MGNSSSKGGPHKNGRSLSGLDLRSLSPLTYTPHEAKNYIRSRTVLAAHFVAHSVLGNNKNYWHIYLQTGKEESISVDFVPGAHSGPEGYLGRLRIVHHPYPVTRNCHKIVSIPAAPGPGHPVSHFLDAVAEADNYRYEFTAQGKGYSGWVRDQFYLFVRCGYLQTGWEKDIEAAIHTAWEDERALGPRSVTYGTYLTGGKRHNRHEK